MNALLLDAKETEKQEEGPTILHPFLGGLENGQEVVPPFFPKKRVFKILKNPYFIVFPEKVGGGHFFQKGLCYKEETFRGAKKNDNFFGSFRQKSLRSHQKRGVKHSDVRVPVVFAVCCCCFLFVVVIIVVYCCCCVLFCCCCCSCCLFVIVVVVVIAVVVVLVVAVVSPEHPKIKTLKRPCFFPVLFCLFLFFSLFIFLFLSFLSFLSFLYFLSFLLSFLPFIFFLLFLFLISFLFLFFLCSSFLGVVLLFLFFQGLYCIVVVAAIILVFGVDIMIFVLLLFSFRCCCCCVFMLLCCYVRQSHKKEKKTPKSGSTSGYFNMTGYGCMCESYCVVC